MVDNIQVAIRAILHSGCLPELPLTGESFSRQQVVQNRRYGHGSPIILAVKKNQ